MIDNARAAFNGGFGASAAAARQDRGIGLLRADAAGG
jgi:hypothetical protein